MMSLSRSAHIPKFSVIIPTRNRCRIVLRCVAALQVQVGLTTPLEVVVVDDGSEDDTVAALRRIGSSPLASVVVLTQPAAGANAARNLGLAKAKGRIIGFLNDDSIPVAEWASAHLDMHERYPQVEAAVLGAIQDDSALPPSIFNELHRPAGLDGLADGAILDWHRFYTYNLTLKRDALADHRFHEGMRWHEDIELGWRLARSGLTVRFAPTALVMHDHAISERDYFRMADREGASLATWYRTAPEALPDLVPLGFRARALGTQGMHHMLADTLIRNSTYWFWVRLARIAARIRIQAGPFLYQKLFRWRSRRALEQGLAQAPH